MMNKLLLLLALFISFESIGQFATGFDKKEYEELLLVTAHNSNQEYSKNIALPKTFVRQYASPEVGLQNKWELWSSENKVAISLRASIATGPSWLENFYAAMIPAEGNLVIDNNKIIPYKFAANPLATIHVGWSLGAILLLEDILPKIDSCYQAGITDFFIIGHSQGGALASLVHSALFYRQQERKLPAQMRFKSYCSAQPKVGNLYYAYDFEANLYQQSFTILNAKDWVPEVPFSIQTTEDFNTVNGITTLKKVIKKQPLIKRIALKSIYNKLDRPLKKSRKNFQKTLGNLIFKFVSKEMKEFPKPTYSKTMHYSRSGTPIILNNFDEVYTKRFPDSSENFMVHHSFESYLYLLEKWNH